MHPVVSPAISKAGLALYQHGRGPLAIPMEVQVIAVCGPLCYTPSVQAKLTHTEAHLPSVLFRMSGFPGSSTGPLSGDRARGA